MGGGNFKISWRTDSYASIEQYRLLYRKSPVRKLVVVFVRRIIERKYCQLDDSSHSYAWTSVVIPGPQHTVQQKYNNKATFTLNQLEIQVDYQVSHHHSHHSHHSPLSPENKTDVSLSQVQVQAKNAFGWGKVSEQFTFRTNAAGESRAE